MSLLTNQSEIKFIPPEDSNESKVGKNLIFKNIKFVPPELIGERIKEREQIYLPKVHPWQYAVLRYDGHNFSTFTKGFKKPFDDNMKNAMEYTLMDVVNKFNPIVGCVHSDEITIIFKPYYQSKEEYESADNKSCHPFDGKRDKLISVIAGYISARFNFHVMHLINSEKDNYKEGFVNTVNQCCQHFDGRMLVYEANETTELLNYFVWRQNDCLRNCISTYARHLFSQKQVMYKKFNEMVDMINTTETKVDDINPDYKNGVFAKKQLIEKDGIDRKTNEPVKVTRGIVSLRNVKVSAQSEFEYLLLEKYWK